MAPLFRLVIELFVDRAAATSGLIILNPLPFLELTDAN